MATVKISALAALAAASISATDVMPLVDDMAGTPTTKSVTVAALRTALLTNAFTGTDYLAVGAGTIPSSGRIRHAAGTITASDPLINSIATWNDAGVTFTHILVNITDTASAAASMFWDYQIAGSSKASLTKAGAATFASNVASAAAHISTGSLLGGHQPSMAVMDFVSGAARWLSYGANTSTNGTFEIITRRSDGSSGVTAVAINGTGAVTLASTLAVTTTITASHVTVGSSGYFAWNSRGLLKATADGNFAFRNNADSDYGTLSVANLTAYSGTVYFADSNRFISVTGSDLIVAVGAAVVTTFKANGDVCFLAGKKLFLDGGGNSYIWEGSADVITAVAGGTAYLQIVGGVGVNLDNVATTASAANTFIDTGSGNTLKRSTSSLRYKQDVSPLSLNAARNIVLNAQPIRYKPKGGGAEHIGLSAEQIHELDNRMTTVDKEGRPDWVQYPHLTAPLMLVVQEQEKRIAKLEARLVH